MPSLTNALQRELARLFEPLVVAAGSAERWPLVLALVGHTADVAGDPGLRAALDDLSALAALGDANVETWEGIESILTASARAVRALRELERTANDPALASRVQQLGRELAGQITAVYLRRYHERLFRLAALLNVVDPAEAHNSHPAVFAGDVRVRTAWTSDELHPERVGPLLRDPGKALREAYLPNNLATASDAHAAADRLFPRLRAVISALGLASAVEQRSLAPAPPEAPSNEGDHFNNPEPLPEEFPPPPPPPDLGPYYRTTQPRLTIRVPQLQPDGSLAGTFLGIAVAASSSEHPGGVAGMIVELTGALNWTQTRGPWTLIASSQGTIPVFVVGPDGLKLAATGSGASFQLVAKRQAAAPGTPAFVFGPATGSRIELGTPQFAVTLNAAQTVIAVTLSADTGKSALVLDPGDGDGFLSGILPKEGVRADFELGLEWSNERGLTLRGSTGLDVTLPIGLSIGPVTVPTLHLSLRADDAGLQVEVSAGVGVTIGPVNAVIDRMGIAAAVNFPEAGGNLGLMQLDSGFKPPSGIGLSIDARGVLTGGGFLFHDRAADLYAGVLQLSLKERITLTAFGLIATRLPDGSKGYSLIVFITAEGFKPIPLGLGLTLQGIGGMLAIHRTFDETAMREGLKNNTLGTLLFPRDPIRNAPQIIRNLATIFPAKQGSYLLGLLVKLGWFSPTLVTLDLGLIFEFGTRKRLIALGRIQSLLPSRDNALIRLNLDALGLIDFDEGTVEIDAVLVDSRLAHKFVLTGGMALRARLKGPGAGFVLAIGGFNPNFKPPAGMPKVERIAIALSSGDNPRLTCEAYYAITSNTIQYGARAELYAAAFGFSVHGDIGYDVLVQLAPFHFLAEFHASLQLKRGSRSLFKVSLAGALQGPRPLRVSGKASFEIFWCDFSIRFDKTLVSGERPPPPPAVDVLAELKRALSSNESWSTQLPLHRQHGVTLRKLAPGANVVLDPLGNLVVKQQIVPLNAGRDIDTFGGAPVAGARRFQVGATLGGGAQQVTFVKEGFAPAQFFAMSDDEKISSPSFVDMDAGLVFGSEAVVFAPAQAVASPLEYETVLIDEEAPANAPPAERYPLHPERLLQHARLGAVARAPIRHLGLNRFRTPDVPQAVALRAPNWVIASVDDAKTVAAETQPGAIWNANHATMLGLNRQAGGARRWQLIPEYEVAA